MLFKLALSNFRVHKIRFALTVAAVALSVSLVVAVTSGYASAEGAAQYYLNKYLGSTDAQITREGHTPMDAALLDEVRRDPDVARAVGRLENDSTLLNKDGRPVGPRRAQIVGIVRPDDTRVNTMSMVAGQWFEGDSGDVAVVDQVAAEMLGMQVGWHFALPGPTGALKLRVVGIVHKPGILAAHMQTVYVPLRTLQKFALPNQPAQITRILIEFKSDTRADQFLARWQPKLAAIDPMLKVKLTRENRRDLDRNLQGIHMLSYMGGAVSMAAAAFIIFSALSMGVTERQRTLAMLRAIGMERARVGKLVVVEGLVLAGIGALVGVPLGMLWVQILCALPQFEEILVAGVVISWGGVAMGVIGSLLTALAASFLPAWSAMRVAPLDAMSPLAHGPRSRVPWKLAALGAGLIVVDTFLMFGPLDWLIPWPAIAKATRFYGHFAVGIPALMIGFFLVAPLFVRGIERALGPIIAAMMGLRFALLRQQLSAGLWRAAGTCAALMVGLAILVVMNVQGTTMLSGWKLPDRFPDVFIAAPVLSPMTPQAIRKIENTPGIKKDAAGRPEVLPIAIASPQFANPVFAMLGAAMMPDATMFFGIDPDRAFDMMELDFRQGSAEQAKELLKKGRHIVVTEEFHKIKGLTVGDTLALKTPLHGEVEYTIAGVVWSPGIDVIVSMQDMGRQFDQRTAASLFGTLEDARNDFGIERVYLVAANLDAPLEKKALVWRVQHELGLMGMQVGDIRAIKHGIQSGLQTLLLLASTVAVAAMAVASLGVTNTIMASVRSRRWEMGILRSIGVTRGQMLRLILAEAILLGIVSCALGLCAGGLMSLNARGLAAMTIGYLPPPDVPWWIILTGSAAVMLIAITASLYPAWTASRTDPLTLLQSGRAAT